MNIRRVSLESLTATAQRLIYEEDLPGLQDFLAALPAGAILPCAKNGLSPLHTAANAGLPEFCRALLPYSDAQAATPSGRTTLMLACHHSHSCAQVLLPFPTRRRSTATAWDPSPSAPSMAKPRRSSCFFPFATPTGDSGSA